jgi:hypothetical protein
MLAGSITEVERLYQFSQADILVTEGILVTEATTTGYLFVNNIAYLVFFVSKPPVNFYPIVDVVHYQLAIIN